MLDSSLATKAWKAIKPSFAHELTWLVMQIESELGLSVPMFLFEKNKLVKVNKSFRGMG